VVLVMVNGCSSGVPAPPNLAPTVPVSGTVTLDGKALEGANVTFVPETKEGFKGAIGRSDASGKYELNTDVGGGKSSKGAIPGKYRITVSRLVKPDGSTLPPDFKEPPMNVGAMESIPMKYSSAGSTQLTYEVPAAGGTYDIPLTSK
jgi:hypothetical protein